MYSCALPGKNTLWLLPNATGNEMSCMSSIQLNFFSRCLNFRTEVKVVLPEYPGQRDFSIARKEAFDASLTFPAVYLLHGYTGDYSDWMSMIPMERYAEKYGLAIVMPHGYNSWYCNLQNGPQVESYIAEELPAVMEAVLPISERAEQRFIAGLSMGGSGAVQIGLAYPARYRAMASASAVFSCDLLAQQYDEDLPEQKEMLARMRFAYRERPDALAMYHASLASGKSMPEHLCLYGTEDEMYPYQYRAFQAFVQESKAPVRMECRAGKHDFEFWDSAVQRMLQWFSSFKEKC